MDLDLNTGILVDRGSLSYYYQQNLTKYKEYTLTTNIVKYPEMPITSCGCGKNWDYILLKRYFYKNVCKECAKVWKFIVNNEFDTIINNVKMIKLDGYYLSYESDLLYLHRIRYLLNIIISHIVNKKITDYTTNESCEFHNRKAIVIFDQQHFCGECVNNINKVFKYHVYKYWLIYNIIEISDITNIICIKIIEKIKSDI